MHADLAADGPTQPARPTTLLTRTQLIQVSIFWFATNAMWGGWEIYQQERGIEFFGGELAAGVPLIVMELAAMPVAALAMPIFGSLSDYASTPWGRRKPFILVGSVMAFLTLVALAFVPTFAMMVVLFILFQLSTHIARNRLPLRPQPELEGTGTAVDRPHSPLMSR